LETMKLSEEKVEHIAKLARLGLTERENKKFQKELSAILDFVEQLNKAKTEKVEPTAQVTGLENVSRQDKSRAKTKKETEKLLELVPETKDGYVKVKAVL
jgi:aspartyl-tRNA(Asn)/glutamyl-tRNA(Gln) amidotransferase subunit C